MKSALRSRLAFGMVVFAAALALAVPAFAQRADAGASDILRFRGRLTVTPEKTPIYQARTTRPQTSAAPADWARISISYETSPEWIDELEFIYYVYVKDQSNRGAEVMFRGAVTYINVARGRNHQSDIFIHPSTIARMGKPEYVAVVVKHRGAVVATESTAQTPNWWERLSPVDGVLLNRAQTPFALIDYDMFNAIKPAAAAR
jgi:hypothetical protein